MTVVIGPNNQLPNIPKKWALFDLDWTLIRPIPTKDRPRLKGGLYSQMSDDWTIIPGRIGKLKDLLKDNYTIGIITNQKSSENRLFYTLQRLNAIYQFLVQTLETVIYIMASIDDRTMAIPGSPTTLYRKPGIGWSFHLRFLEGSFYVGDAVQDPFRPERGWGFSNVDFQFAENLGLPFYSETEFFPQLSLPEELFKSNLKLFILVGPPGSGKTTFAKKFSQLYNLAHIESSNYTSNIKQIDKAVKIALIKRNSTIIDATNPSRKRRLSLISLAAEHGAEAVIILFVNQGKWSSNLKTPAVPVANNRYWSNYEEPDPEIEKVSVYYQV